MTDNMPIITKWLSLFDWTMADISKTEIFNDVNIPSTCFLSARAHGVKGKVPGARHTWISSNNGSGWLTYEVTDIATIKHLGGEIKYAAYSDIKISQLICSNRDPGLKWFNNSPRLDFVTDYIDLTEILDYPMNHDIDLIHNNCNTFISYVIWKYNIHHRPLYIGFKPKKYWNSFSAQ